MSTFDRRRHLTRKELMPAVGAGVAAGVGVGLVVFYAARLMLQREPLRPLPAAGSALPAKGAPAVPTSGSPAPVIAALPS